MIPWLGPRDPFPPVSRALRDPNGLLAAGADLSPPRLLDAYAHGIFPWSGDDEPLLWWSPDPRMVLWLPDLHVSRSLRRVLRSGRYRVTLDTAFAEIMAGCAAPRTDQQGTWITPWMMEAYGRLAELGHAHSVEVWAGAELAGGLYGVALVTLVRQLERWGFELIDCQLSTAHLASLGAREIPRAQFLGRVEQLVRVPGVPAPWVLDPDLPDAAGTMEKSAGPP